MGWDHLWDLHKIKSRRSTGSITWLEWHIDAGTCSRVSRPSAFCCSATKVAPLLYCLLRHLDNLIGSIRFTVGGDKEEVAEQQDRLAELELLRKYLAEAAEAVDRCEGQIWGAQGICQVVSMFLASACWCANASC
jgi:hypothetical protein